MCGIIGQINFSNAVDENIFSSMRDTLAHRGPDGFGSWFSDDKKIALVHRRLSFLDLSESGKQPNMDIKCFMGELVLTKIDRASMANSLEVRVPYS